jgi:hypothetical protein
MYARKVVFEVKENNICRPNVGKCVTDSIFGNPIYSEGKETTAREFTANTQKVENMNIGNTTEYPGGWPDFASKLNDLMCYGNSLWSEYNKYDTEHDKLLNELRSCGNDKRSTPYRGAKNRMDTNKRGMKSTKEKIRLLHGWYDGNQKNDISLEEIDKSLYIDNHGGYLNSCFMFWFRVLLLRNERELEKNFMMEAAKNASEPEDITLCTDRLRKMILRDVFNINQHSPATDQNLELHDKIGAYFLHTIGLPNIIANTGYSGTGFLAKDLHSKCGSFQEKNGHLFQSIYLDPVKGCIGFIIQYADYISCQSFPNKLSAQRQYFQGILSFQVSEALQNYRSGFPVCELDKFTEQANFVMEHDRFFNGTDVSSNDGSGVVHINETTGHILRTGIQFLFNLNNIMTFQKPSNDESAWRENVVFHPLIHALPGFLVRTNDKLASHESNIEYHVFAFLITALMYHYKPDKILYEPDVSVGYKLTVMFDKDYSPTKTPLVIHVGGERYKEIQEEFNKVVYTGLPDPTRNKATKNYIRSLWTEIVFKQPPGDKQVIPFPTWYTSDFVGKIQNRFRQLGPSPGDERASGLTLSDIEQNLQVGMVHSFAQTDDLDENERHVYIQKCFGSQGNLDHASIESAKDILVQMWTNLQPLVGKRMFGKCNSLIQSLVDGIRC